jgi:hypothetical protein
MACFSLQVEAESTLLAMTFLERRMKNEQRDNKIVGKIA